MMSRFPGSERFERLKPIRLRHAEIEDLILGLLDREDHWASSCKFDKNPYAAANCSDDVATWDLPTMKHIKDYTSVAGEEGRAMAQAVDAVVTSTSLAGKPVSYFSAAGNSQCPAALKGKLSPRRLT